MQDLERVVSTCVATGRGKGGDIRIGTRQRSVAQIKARREPLDGTAQDTLGIACLDFTLHQYCELSKRAFRREGMSNVAEGIFVLMQPAVGRDVDAPAHDVLAVVVAWREPQHLADARRWCLILVVR